MSILKNKYCGECGAHAVELDEDNNISCIYCGSTYILDKGNMKRKFKCFIKVDEISDEGYNHLLRYKLDDTILDKKQYGLSLEELEEIADTIRKYVYEQRKEN